jgi:hypothetical protein
MRGCSISYTKRNNVVGGNLCHFVDRLLGPEKNSPQKSEQVDDNKNNHHDKRGSGNNHEPIKLAHLFLPVNSFLLQLK